MHSPCLAVCLGWLDLGCILQPATELAKSPGVMANEPVQRRGTARRFSSIHKRLTRAQHVINRLNERVRPPRQSPACVPCAAGDGDSDAAFASSSDANWPTHIPGTCHASTGFPSWFACSSSSPRFHCCRGKPLPRNLVWLPSRRHPHWLPLQPAPLPLPLSSCLVRFAASRKLLLDRSAGSFLESVGPLLRSVAPKRPCAPCIAESDPVASGSCDVPRWRPGSRESSSALVAWPVALSARPSLSRAPGPLASPAPTRQTHRSERSPALHWLLPTAFAPDSAPWLRCVSVVCAVASDRAAHGSVAVECNWDESIHAATDGPATDSPSCPFYDHAGFSPAADWPTWFSLLPLPAR